MGQSIYRLSCARPYETLESNSRLSQAGSHLLTAGCVRVRAARAGTSFLLGAGVETDGRQKF